MKTKYACFFTPCCHPYCGCITVKEWNESRKRTSKEQTIEQRLAEKGYGHRKTANSANTGKHAIYSLETGEVLGEYDALTAIEWLENSAD